MQLPENPFKRALHAGTQQIGLWCAVPSNYVSEILAGAGFDWLVLDTEHAPNELPNVFNQLQSMVGYGTQPVVRVPWNDAVTLKRFLDIGTQSFLIPMVQDAEEARAAVAATRYPPDGIRGYAVASRATRFGRIGDYFTRYADEMCVLVQVETMEALEKVEEIAAVPGVDGIFIGPGDLSASMGLLHQPTHPRVVEAIEDGLRRITAAGNRGGVLVVGDEALARRYMAAGSVFTAVGVDAALFARSSEALAKQYKG
ncbi:4-hydroxy-2-oxoheptanedioate aldolase [Xanthobacter flavus]|uniref:2,4-dihydroxyhept-2-ene-1,7-dioic acid aldolase n=1 Tax=Xanthobacter flavus TaxID=281 RepID=A0A9W6FK69_XANFL|nr:aldolase/citrate lyase family protein [Xanthobacter flavus]MDR6333634.1 4-hydroxy-2-oxoheptanedioate aldolase [Xanthobacter flavus]GLI20613.1 2,4-dihydroxyhept-2-ene-1,7-dioic acid aldolase [Xanthobacter flavus]